MFGFQAQVGQTTLSGKIVSHLAPSAGLLGTRHFAASGALRRLHGSVIPRIGGAGERAEVDVFK